MNTGGSVIFLGADFTMGVDAEGDSFGGLSISLGISAIEAELHAGIGYATISHLIMYQGKLLFTDLTQDMFSDLPQEIQEMLVEQLNITQ